MAGMWLPAGTSVNRRDVERMTSASAWSQLSNQGGSAYKRSNRFMLNLTGPGAHFTMVAAATVYESIRSILHMIIIQSWSVGGVQSIWETREIATNGLARAMVDAMRTLGIVWSAPFVLKCGDVECSFSAPLRASLSGNCKNCGKIMRSSEVAEVLHNTRRCAENIPYCFAGLESGMSEVDRVRRSTFSMRHLLAGPAMSSGGMWTELSESRMNWKSPGLCVRCGAEVETVTHRLWRCADNEFFKEWLLAQLRAREIDVTSFHACLLRCGLAPSQLPNWTVDGESRGSLPLKLCLFSRVASVATSCAAKAHKDESFPEKRIWTIFDEALRKARVLAIPPVEKLPRARCADREILNLSRLAKRPSNSGHTVFFFFKRRFVHTHRRI